MSIFGRIKFDGLTTKEWLIYKYPGEKHTSGTPLIVGEGQAAFFVNKGQLCDVFKPGTYRLNTNNLPVLNSIANWPYGGKTAFTAEVYFINTTTKLDMKWGTTDPIQIIDPKYAVLMHTRAFGQFSLKIVDYTLFFKEVVGALDTEAVDYSKVLDYFKGILMTKLKVVISELIVNKGISLLEVAPRLEEISKLAQDKIAEYFNKYGFEVVDFFVQSINVPDEDLTQIKRILEDKAAFDIIGDNRYATMRSFDVYESAAENSGGISSAFVASGIGIGMAHGLNNPSSSIVKSEISCQNCGTKNLEENKFCNDCGQKLKLSKIACPSCGIEAKENSKFCSECGESFLAKNCTCGEPVKLGAKFCENCGNKF